MNTGGFHKKRERNQKTHVNTCSLTLVVWIPTRPWNSQNKKVIARCGPLVLDLLNCEPTLTSLLYKVTSLSFITVIKMEKCTCERYAVQQGADTETKTVLAGGDIPKTQY